MTKSEAEPRDIDFVLDFIVHFSSRMIVSGANLERVNLAVEQICHGYDIRDVSVYLLSTHIIVSGKDDRGEYRSRQLAIPAGGIQLERLKRLNRLSYDVCREKPEPKRLMPLLEEASAVEEYPRPVLLLAQMAALACLCLIFGGSWGDVTATAAVAFVMYWILAALAKPGLDKVVTNAAVMWAAATLSILLVLLGIGQNCSVIIISVSMMVIPGIPLVNAVRNLLCGNEMNGIFQLLKIVIESLALALGVYVSIHMFGGLISW